MLRHLLYYLLLFPLFIKAQLPQKVQVTHFDETNSGMTGTVNCVYQAQDGYLWYGSSNGLFRYDGYAFTPIHGHPGTLSNITHITEDRDHNIWMSYATGAIASYTPKTGLFKFHPLFDSAKSGNTVEIIQLFFDHANLLWIGTYKNGLVSYDDKANKIINYPLLDKHHQFYAPAVQKIYNTVYAIYEDAGRRLWLATHDGLYMFRQGMSGPVSIREKPVDPKTIRRDLFRDIQPDGDSLWLCSWNGGLSCYRPTTNKWHNFLPDEKNFGKPTTNIIKSIHTKNSNELWVCSQDKGLGIFNKKTRQFFFLSNDSHYPDVPKGEWYTTTLDREGNIWGLEESGLFKIQVKNDGFYRVEVPVAHSDNNSNYGIDDYWEDNEIQLIGTGFADGLHVLNKHTGKRSTLKFDIIKKEEPVLQVRKILYDQNKQVWILTRDFLYKYDQANNKLIKTAQPPLFTDDSLSNSFYTLFDDGQNHLWIGSNRNGAFSFDKQTGKFEHHYPGGSGKYYIPFNNIRSFAKDALGRLWMAGSDGVLGFFNNGKFNNLPVGYGEKYKIPGNQGYAVFADHSGNIWAGTTTGLYLFDCHLIEPMPIRIFRGHDGLRFDLVYNINEDDNHNIWCLTDAAICLLPSGNGPVQSFSTADGIKRGTGTRIIRLRSDTMLLLNYGGYYVFEPNRFLKHTHNHPLYINAMQVNGKPFYYDSLLRKNGNVRLKAEQNFISFEFAALNFTHPEKQQYAYMLKGFDKDWIAAGNRRYVSYTNIPGGNYTFMVKTIEPNADERVNMLSVPLFIATPFTKTIWFYLLLLSIAGLLVYAIYHNRLNHHRQISSLETKAQILEKEKALVMYEGLKQQLNPHFLFNSLTSLNSLILKDQKLAKIFLEQMSAMYRYILKSRENELVLLSKELEFVQTYIQLLKTRFKESLQVHIAVNEEQLNCKIVPVTLQNLIENATKHNILDVESPLIISIYSEDNYLVVANNLQKKKIVETSNRQGLRNMKTLYSYLTDNPVIIEQENEQFIIKIPLI